MGRRRDDVRKGYRGLPVGDYIIFYVIEDDGIAVVHVTHGARRDLV
jgi:plasmid stabilization system protein ParE